MRTREAAELIGVTVQHVQLLARTGKLPARKVRTDRNQHGHEWTIRKVDAERYARDRAAAKV